MKITDVKLRFAKHYLFVQIYTDAGIVGLGEAGNWGYLNATAEAILKFKDHLIGKDPFRIEDFNQNYLRSVYFRGSVIMSAISAIDIALWDIKGKALGVPVYELLGGKTREKIRVYASVMQTSEPGKLIGNYKALQDQGCFSQLMAAQEEIKTLPFGEIWDEYCRRCGKPAGGEWFAEIEAYAKKILEERA